jgi:hypothetical protein
VEQLLEHETWSMSRKCWSLDLVDWQLDRLESLIILVSLVLTAILSLVLMVPFFTKLEKMATEAFWEHEN